MKKILFPAILFFAMPLFSLDVNKDNIDKQKTEKMRIAVMDFEAKDITSKDAVKYSELIRNDIVNSGQFVVIERSQMGQILKEQGLQQTGCTDVSCAVEIGKVLSARKILVGTIMKIEDQIIITGRIVDVENGTAEISEKAIAANKNEIVTAVSIFVDRLADRITNPDGANADKLRYKKAHAGTVENEGDSFVNPYSNKMIWSIAFTGTFFGSGYFFDTRVSKTNDDISSLEDKYNMTTSTTEAVALHDDIVSRQDKSKKLALYRNIFYGAGSVTAILTGYYFYKYFTYSPVKADVSGNYTIQLILPVCLYNTDRKDINADVFYLGAGLTARF